MPPLKAAIIGYGMSHKIFHAPFLAALPSLFTLVGIVQRNPTPSNSAPTDYPHLAHWTSHTAMLSDSSTAIDLVIVTSSPDAHYDQVRASLLAGKHVVCEKPFVPTSAEALELAQLARDKGLVLTVYQNRRWDSDFLTLRRILDEGTLGRLVDIDTRFDRWRIEPPTAATASWKFQQSSASGAIYDLGTHLLDQLVVLFGLPERVTGFFKNNRVYTEAGTGGEMGGDSFTAHLHYDSRGLTATAATTVASCTTEQVRYAVRGDRGSYMKWNTDVQEDQLKAGMKPGDEGFGFDKGVGVLTTVGNEGKMERREVKADDPPVTYTEFYRAVHAAVVGEGENPVPAEPVAKVLRLIEIIKESAKEGRTLDVRM